MPPISPAEILPHGSQEVEVPPAEHTDVCIAGGGLAGLALAIQLARAGFQVVLLEKERYPFHRVCGEYVSMESWPFLEQLGLPLATWKLPSISQLTVTAPNGQSLSQALPLGGFGISRYLLDQSLADLARQSGVQVREGVKATDIRPDKTGFVVDTTAGRLTAQLALGSFGKRSNLDLHWKRSFAMQKAGPLQNYVGVKYHIDYAFPLDRIALHNFPHGYCGISAVESGKYCLCYLTTADNLRQSGGSLRQMESSVLSLNPHLRKIFREANFLWPEPVAISQVSFARKETAWNQVLLCGDAAGMITPLCGNGMSMALHGSKLLAELSIEHLRGAIDHTTMEAKYRASWNHHFAGRLRTGRMIQSLFGHPLLTNLFLGAMKPFPFLVRALVKQTHGDFF